MTKDTTKNTKERQRKHANKQREKGLTTTTVWVPIGKTQELRLYAENLTKAHEGNYTVEVDITIPPEIEKQLVSKAHAESQHVIELFINIINRADSNVLPKLKRKLQIIESENLPEVKLA